MATPCREQSGRLFPVRLSLKIEGHGQRQDESRDAKQRGSWNSVGLKDDDFSRHGDEGYFDDQANMDDIFPDICLKSLQQLDADKDQQEKREDLEQALHRD